MAAVPLPAPIEEALNRLFLRQVAAHPRGKATMLQMLADEEGGNGGELDLFEHMLAVIDDDEVRKIVRLHKADEERHERLYAERARSVGVAPIQVPNAARLLYRLDAHVGFFSRPITTRAQVADAYLLLWVIEERAIRQFGKQRAAFLSVGDTETAAIIDEVSRDEERHLRYCQAVSKRYMPDDAARMKRLAELRALEEQCFREVQQIMLQIFVDEGVVPAGPWGMVWRALASMAKKQVPIALPATA
jgi:rubrerythrin